MEKVIQTNIFEFVAFGYYFECVSDIAIELLAPFSFVGCVNMSQAAEDKRASLSGANSIE